jgi:mono/diheme cytochrome c family protein
MKLMLILLVGSLFFVLVFSCNSTYSQGMRLYETHCASCHMSDGKGLAALFPPLAQSDYLHSKRDKIACIIKYGLHDTIQVNGIQYDIPMEGFSTLNSIEINNICNYIFTSWGNKIPVVSISETELFLTNCKD